MSVSILSQGFAELNLHERSLTAGLMTEFETIIEQNLFRTLSNREFEHEVYNNLWRADERESGRSLLPAYVTPAYEWLLSHIHNPYPSNTFKHSLSMTYNISLKSVNIWFANVRRRIGWTAISKRFFNGSRADTVDYAHRVFKRRVSDVPLNEAISGEFLLMKMKTEKLYQGKLDEYVSSKALHTPPDNDNSDCLLDESYSDRRMVKKVQLRDVRLDVVCPVDGTSACPSSPLSRKRLRAGSSSFDSLKMLSSYLESDVTEQFRKRVRTPSSSSTQSSSSRSSTPMPSTPKDDFPVEFAFEDWRKGIEDGKEKVDESTLPSPIPTSRPKKRRLSQSDELPLPSKRPRGMPLPRLHTVSDSYVQNRALFNVEPCASHINLTTPKPATINDRLPDDTEISLFQDWGNLSSLGLLSAENPQVLDVPVIEPDTPTLVSTASSSPQDDGHNPSGIALTLDLPNLADLDKFLEALAADPSLLPPLLPDGFDEVSLFDSNFLTSLGGLEFPPLAALDVPLSTTLVETETDSVARLLCSDVASVPPADHSLSTFQKEGDFEKSTESTSDSNSSDLVEDKLEMTTIVDEPSLLLDLLCPVSPVETKASMEISPVTEPILKNENTDNPASDTREDKLQKLQMLMAEVERLKQEISC